MLRRRGFGMILAFLLTLPGGGAVLARDQAGAWEAGAFFDYTHYDVSSRVGDATGFGVRGGYHFTDRHEVELAFTSASGTSKETAIDLDIDRTLIAANYLHNFLPKNKERMDPFLVFGIGRLDLDYGTGSMDSMTLRAGGGVKWFFTPRVALRFDVAGAYWHGDGSLTPRSAYFALDSSLGVSVLFGGGGKTAPPAPAGKEGEPPAAEK